MGHVTTWMPGREFQMGKFGVSELELWGLDDPEGFRKMVMDMKKQGKSLAGVSDGASNAFGSPPAQLTMDSGSKRVEVLLEEQVALLKSIDASLKARASPP